MNNHTLKLNHSRNIIIAALVVLLGIAGAVTVYALQSNKSDTAVTNKVELSTSHKTYASVEELVSSSDVTFVGRAVVLDDGTVRSEKVSRVAEAPPEVHTDYKLDVQSVIKGENVPSEVTIAVMGGKEKDTRYVYENVPTLKKGDVVVVFAYLADDGKYYPMSGSTAIALQNADGSFSLTKSTVGTEDITTFTEQDIAR